MAISDGLPGSFSALLSKCSICFNVAEYGQANESRFRRNSLNLETPTPLLKPAGAVGAWDAGIGLAGHAVLFRFWENCP